MQHHIKQQQTHRRKNHVVAKQQLDPQSRIALPRQNRSDRKHHRQQRRNKNREENQRQQHFAIAAANRQRREERPIRHQRPRTQRQHQQQLPRIAFNAQVVHYQK